MFVEQILKAKESGDILTIKPTANVKEAIVSLAEHRVGALVVSSTGTSPEGILSERDIVRELATMGEHLLQKGVTSIMSRQVISCQLTDTADHILSVMTTSRFRHMPVLDRQVMVGLISIGDVVKARLNELNLERDALEEMVSGH